MKNGVFLAVILSLLAGCTSHTRYGDCVGVVDQRDPKLVYDYSVWNIFLGLLFSETIIVPAIVVAKNLQCPSDVRK